MTFDILMQLVIGVDASEAGPYVAPHTMEELWGSLAKGLFSLPINIPGTRKVPDSAVSLSFSSLP
jgi:hypothetical protein